MATSHLEIIQRLGPGNYRRISRKSGFTPQHVSRVLRGVTGARLDAAAKIADAAGVSLDQLWRYITDSKQQAA